jgi:VanZ family protein
MPTKPAFIPDDGSVQIARGAGAQRAPAPGSRATGHGQAPSSETSARFRAGGPLARLPPLIRIAAWLALLAVVVLSVVPGSMRPHVLESDHFEHFIAYFMTACLLAIGYPRPLGLLASGIMLTLCAGGLELVQLWVPGRTASIGDFNAGMLGTCGGILAVLAAAWSSHALHGLRRP